MSKPIGSYRDLLAWQKAFGLGLSVYRATAVFPAEERFGLTSQIRRNGVSVASNIAEGYGRGSTVDYIRFLKVARGSLYELETQILFAKELGYLGENVVVSLLDEWGDSERVLAGLIRSLQRQGS